MSNARFSILQAVAVSDRRVSDAQFRTLAALGMYADKNGWCFPSLKTLAFDLRKSPQAVGRDTIALRKLGYLEVKNRYDAKTKSRHSNLYRLKYDLPDFNMGDTPLSTKLVDSLSTSDVEVNAPINDPKEQVFLSEKEIQQVNAKVDAIIAGGQSQTQLDSLHDFERIFGFGALPWYSNTAWDKFAKWIIKQGGAWFADYVQWRNGEGKYKAFSNKKIRENPAAFIDTGYPEYEASKMYRKTDEDRGVYAPQIGV